MRKWLLLWPSPFGKIGTRSYFLAMRAVGLKTLKNKLNQYVRMAANGETILVTDRGRAIAQLCPPRAGRSSGLADATLAEVVRQGWLSPPALRAATCRRACQSLPLPC